MVKNLELRAAQGAKSKICSLGPRSALGGRADGTGDSYQVPERRVSAVDEREREYLVKKVQEALRIIVVC